MTVPDRREPLFRYLLGDLAEGEQDALLSQYLSRDERFQELLAAEEDLIDAYVEGTLSGADRARFESHFLCSPQRHERLAFARAFLEHPLPATDLAPAPPPRRWLPLVAALALVLAGGGWLSLQLRAIRGELAGVRAEREALRSEVREQSTQIARLTEERALASGLPAGSIVAAVLTAGQERDQPVRAIGVPRGAQWLRLRLLLGEDAYTRYHATVTTAEGRELARLEELTSIRAEGGAVVEVMLPAGTLAHGDYLIALSGSTHGTTEPVATYHLVTAIQR